MPATQERAMTQSYGWTVTRAGMLRSGIRAQRSRTVTVRDIALFTQIGSDRNPLHFCTLATTIANRHGEVCLQGKAGTWTAPLIGR
jgi:acyl dehydratase